MGNLLTSFNTDKLGWFICEKAAPSHRLRVYTRKPEPNVNEPASDDPTLLARLEDLLPTLPPDDADLIRRKYFVGETSREIAVQLDTTEKAIESRLVRVRRRLRETILKEASNE